MKIVFSKPDGTCGVICPSPEWKGTLPDLAAKDVPDGMAWAVVNAVDLPKDRAFRNAWELSGGAVIEPVAKVKPIAHEMRRVKREAQMQPLDEIIAKQVPWDDLVQAEADRKIIRDANAVTQVDIDACKDAGEVRTVISRDAL